MDLDRVGVGLGKHPALLLVDMVKGFTDPNCSLGTHCPEVVEANVQLLNAFHEASWPVFFTTVVFRNEQQAPVFRARLHALNQLTPDSKWVEVDERLPREPGDVLIEKQWASSFHKTDLDEQLRQRGVDSLVVTGLTTSGCVRATVVDGLQYDYPVVVPKEAVGDRNHDAHEANLFDMHAKYAEVMPVAQVLAALPVKPS